MYTDPFEITRYFESQMDGMLKDFFHGFGQGFGAAIPPFNGIIIVFFFFKLFKHLLNVFYFKEMLPPGEPSEGDLRNNVLKPGYEYPSIGHADAPKLDMDLDGK